MRILITKINFLGDAVIFLPTLYGLRKSFPNDSITIACSRNTQTIFQKSVDGIETLPIDFKSTRGSRSLVTAAITAFRKSGKHYDVALHAHDEPSFSYLLSRFLGIGRRIGFASGIARASQLLTEALPFGPGRNLIDINFDLVRHMMSLPESSPERVPLSVDNDDVKLVDRTLRDIGYKSGGPIIVIHPYAKLPYKEWGIGNFVDLARTLTSKTGAFVVFVTEKPDAAISYAHHISGLTIHQFAALCQRAHLFIGNNSGPMNVAAAMGISTLVVQGPSPPEWSVYWNDRPHVQVIARHLSCVPCESISHMNGFCTNTAYPNGCMREIKPESVADQAFKIIGTMTASP